MSQCHEEVSTRPMKGCLVGIGTNNTDSQLRAGPLELSVLQMPKLENLEATTKTFETPIVFFISDILEGLFFTLALCSPECSK